MYYALGAAFCIGFVVGMAFGIVRGKKELATELQENIQGMQAELQNRLNKILK